MPIKRPPTRSQDRATPAHTGSQGAGRPGGSGTGEIGQRKRQRSDTGAQQQTFYTPQQQQGAQHGEASKQPGQVGASTLRSLLREFDRMAPAKNLSSSPFAPSSASPPSLPAWSRLGSPGAPAKQGLPLLLAAEMAWHALMPAQPMLPSRQALGAAWFPLSIEADVPRAPKLLSLNAAGWDGPRCVARSAFSLGSFETAPLAGELAAGSPLLDFPPAYFAGPASAASDAASTGQMLSARKQPAQLDPLSMMSFGYQATSYKYLLLKDDMSWLMGRTQGAGSYGKFHFALAADVSGTPGRFAIKEFRLHGATTGGPKRTHQMDAQAILDEHAITSQLRASIEQGVEALLQANPAYRAALDKVRAGTLPTLVLAPSQDLYKNKAFMPTTLELGDVRRLTTDMAGPYQQLAGAQAARGIVAGIGTSFAAQTFLELAQMHAHDQVHMDLKLENTTFNGLGQFKLIDFGLVAHASDLPRFGLNEASLLSPEMLELPSQPMQPLGAAMDVHQLAASAYELLADTVHLLEPQVGEKAGWSPFRRRKIDLQTFYVLYPGQRALNAGSANGRPQAFDVPTMAWHLEATDFLASTLLASPKARAALCAHPENARAIVQDAMRARVVTTQVQVAEDVLTFFVRGLRAAPQLALALLPALLTDVHARPSAEQMAHKQMALLVELEPAAGAQVRDYFANHRSQIAQDIAFEEMASFRTAQPPRAQ